MEIEYTVHRFKNVSMQVAEFAVKHPARRYAGKASALGGWPETPINCEILDHIDGDDLFCFIAQSGWTDGTNIFLADTISAVVTVAQNCMNEHGGDWVASHVCVVTEEREGQHGTQWTCGIFFKRINDVQPEIE